MLIPAKTVPTIAFLPQHFLPAPHYFQRPITDLMGPMPQQRLGAVLCAQGQVYAMTQPHLAAKGRKLESFPACEVHQRRRILA